jgi:purine-binding chemotaxis protein CheW
MRCTAIVHSHATEGGGDVDYAASQTLICSAGRTLCSLPLAAVVETFRPLPIERVPGALDFMLGLSIVRGEPVPVVDLSRLLSGQPATPTRFVIVKAAERRVALAVDSVVGIRPISAERMQHLPPLLRDADSGVVSAIGTLDNALFLMLQASRIVPENFFDDVARRLAS